MVNSNIFNCKRSDDLGRKITNFSTAMTVNEGITYGYFVMYGHPKDFISIKQERTLMTESLNPVL